jgi:hypothetical protein
MKLINHKIMKLRCDIARLMPGKIRLPDDTIAWERNFQLPRIRVTFGSFTAFTHYIKYISLPVLYPWDKTQPMAGLIPIEEAALIALPVVKVAKHMYGTGMRGPYPEYSSIGNEVGTQGCTRMDMI